MDKHSLQCFILAVETGSFRKARARARLTLSGFSGKIKALEKELGFHLFVRETNRTYLSSEGEQFYPFACRYLQEYEEMCRRLRQEQKNPECLRIGINRNHASALDDLVELLVQGPYKVHLHYLEGPSLRYEFSQLKLDAIVSLGLDENEDVIDIPDETSIRLLKDRMLVAADVQNPLASATKLSLRDLASSEFLLTPSSYEELKPYFEDQGLNLRYKALFSEPRRMVRYLYQTEFLSLISEQTVPPSLKSRVAFLDCEELCIPYTLRLHFSTNPDCLNPGGREWLMESLKNGLS